MKGKRYTTEEKIRILRQADGEKKITDLCREHNVSEVTFHRWKKQFGQMDLSMRPSGSRSSNAKTAS